MNGHLPNDGADIHPWMPSSLHGQPNYGACVMDSPVSKICESAGVSIHDREKVYAEMKRVQKEINFKTA